MMMLGTKEGEDVITDVYLSPVVLNSYKILSHFIFQGGVSRRKTTVVVAIEITDVDDHDPVCAQNNVTVRIKENLAPGQLVTTVCKINVVFLYYLFTI